MQAVSWLPRVVVLCASVEARLPGGAPSTELLLYPRHYLDASSLLARYPLKEVSKRATLYTPSNVYWDLM